MDLNGVEIPALRIIFHINNKSSDDAKESNPCVWLLSIHVVVWNTVYRDPSADCADNTNDLIN